MKPVKECRKVKEMSIQENAKCKRFNNVAASFSIQQVCRCIEKIYYADSVLGIGHLHAIEGNRTLRI